MRVKDAVGRWGEQVAADQLTAGGLRILERNWRCAQGEIDIVAEDGDVLVFVEVKTRSSTAFGLPAEAVTPRKQARVRLLSLRWLDAHRQAHPFRAEIRFDVMSIVRDRAGGQTSVNHVRGAF